MKRVIGMPLPWGAIANKGILVSWNAISGQSASAGVAFSLDTSTYVAWGTLPITYSASGLPAGLSIDSATGVISGTPTIAGIGVNSVTVTATNKAGAANVTFNITVAFAWAGVATGQVARYTADLANLVTSQCAEFDGTNYLSVADAAALNHGGVALTGCCWYYHKASGGSDRTIIGKWKTTGDAREYVVWVDDSETKIAVSVSDDGTSGDMDTATPNVALVADTWYFVAWRFDAGTLTAWVNTTSATGSGGVASIHEGAGALTIGAQDVGGTPAQLLPSGARVDNPYIWHAAHADAKVSWLQANKPDYSTLATSTDANNPGVTNLVFAPPLDETSGVRMDLSSSGLHLTEYSTATGAVFDGADYLKATTAAFRSADSSGSVTLSFKTASATEQCLWCTSDDNAAGYYLGLHLTASGGFTIYHGAADTPDVVNSTETGYADNAWHFLELRSSGTAYSLRVDGVALTLTASSGSNSGDWFADTANRDNMVLGVAINNAG